MALLLSKQNCKITDANAFYSALQGTLSNTYSLSNCHYNSPYRVSITFSRNENLTKVYFHYQSQASSSESKNMNFSLVQWKSCTVTSATPAVVTITSHGYSTGDKVRFTATTIPTGMVRGLQYFVNVQSANTFWIYDTYANAIAGGATGRINTTSTGTTVVCNKVISEQTHTFDSLFGGWQTQVTSGVKSVGFTLDFSGVAVTTASNTWAWMVATDDSTITSSQVQAIQVASFGTTTATAVSGSDNFVIEHSVDFTAGFTINGYTNLIWNVNSDHWLNPNFLYDPSASSLGNITLNANSAVTSFTKSGYAFGRPLTFTAKLSAGDTSATLTTAHTGTTGTHLLQLFPRGENDDFQQISASFTNGSTAVTFSALTYNATEYGGIALKQSAPCNLSMTTSSGFANNNNAGLCVSVIMCEETREILAHTTGALAVGATTMTVNKNTGWAVDDRIMIGKQIPLSSGTPDSNTIYTITAITPGAGTDDITFTPAIAASSNRATNAPVGISYFNTGNALQITRPAGSSTIAFSTDHYAKIFIGINNGAHYTFSHSDRLVTTAIPFYFNKLAGINLGLGACKIGAFYKNIVRTSVASMFYLQGQISGYDYTIPIYVQDLTVLAASSFPSTISTTIPYYFKNLYHEGSFGFTLGSAGYKMDNVKMWNVSTATSGGFLGIANFFSNDVKNVYVDNAVTAIGGFTGVATITNVYLGTESLNTYDAGFGQSGYQQIELKNAYLNSPIDTTLKQSNMSPDGYVSFTNIGGTEGNTRVFYKFGESTISGTGLSDTTSRVGNRQLVTFATSNTGETKWTQVIPTGDIQGKDMMVGVWCKIDSADYWSGTHTMPRLVINYDDGTEVYAEAGQTTDWQFLFVPFTPTTTFGSTTSKLSIKSDDNSNVYWGDMSVLYPAGYTLNLGAFNNLRSGLPVTPTISTSVSAQDVWAADPTQFGASTVGDKVNKIKNDTGIIPALL